MQINTQNNINFTAVIPLKIFVDGKPTSNEQIMRKVSKDVRNILLNQSEFHPVIDTVRKYINGFKPFIGLHGRSEVRSSIINNLLYIFTGEEANILDKLGRRGGSAYRTKLREYAKANNNPIIIFTETSKGQKLNITDVFYQPPNTITTLPAPIYLKKIPGNFKPGLIKTRHVQLTLGL